MNENKDIWIFLSHSSQDFDKVRLIRNYLEEKKCRPLMFYLKCLNSEEEILELVKREIDVRSRFIVCDSDNARASKWVKREIDYVTAKKYERSYIRLDMSKPMKELEREIDSYISGIHLFFSYQRRGEYKYDWNIIWERLGKYELRFFCDKKNLSAGVCYADCLKDEISKSAECGYFILLLDDEVSKWQQWEILEAMKRNAKILAIVTSLEAEELCVSSYLDRDQVVRIDVGDKENMSNAIVDEILWRVLPIGGVHTYAHNFRNGVLVSKDDVEADRLDSLLVAKAEKSPNPAALEFLAKCYEKGEHGLPIDLHMASSYYAIAIHEEGREDLIPRARAVNEKLYGGNNTTKFKDLRKLTLLDRMKNMLGVNRED